MAWIRVESSVSRHRKFLQAGPAASWLWLCGLAYCQEGLTNGFIPFEAIDHLGVKGARKLKCQLVAARLWDEVPGGWMVHDYLDWNKDADTIRKLQVERRRAGAKGGRESGFTRRITDTDEATAKQVASANPKQAANPAVPTATSTAQGTATAPLDVAFRVFQSTYPANRRKGGGMAQHAFIAACDAAGGPDAVMSALQNHLASEQWQAQDKIPGMEKWLVEERWRQRLPPARPVGVGVTAKTAGNVEALRRFVNRGQA